MKNFKTGLVCGASSLVLIWVIMMVSLIFPSIIHFGIMAREVSVSGFLGIFFSPLLHENMAHILANSIPLFVLITTLVTMYPRLAVKVIFFSIVLGGSLVWMFGRGQVVSIGASGLIFSLIGFLIFNVFFRKDWKSLLIGIFIGLTYGTCLLGILPSDPHISWEGHLFGFISGIFLAFTFRKEPS